MQQTPIRSPYLEWLYHLFRPHSLFMTLHSVGYAICAVLENIHTDHQEGRGILKANFFIGKYESKLEFPEELGGGGS